MQVHIEPLERRCLLTANGLLGYYYNDITETTRAMTRNDSEINFNFGASAPIPQMGLDYSIKWQAQILPPVTGVYTFYVDATDGVLLSVRGTQIISRWSDGSGELSATIPLAGGQMTDLEMDYYNDTGNGSVQLSWSYPGQAKQIVPNSAIYNTFGENYTFTDPVSPNGADPWVVYMNGEYYYSLSNGGAIFVAASPTLEGIGSAPEVQIFSPPTGTMYSDDIWSPQLHYIDGLWYVYFAADNGNNDNHRMYVLQSTGQDPQGTFTFMGEIAAAPDTGVPTTTSAFPIDHWAIDGTVITIGSQNYLVWSGWDGADPNGQSQVQQNLYIALMSNPWTISGQRYLLSEPIYSWEENGLPINEGPVGLVSPTGKIFITYSASGYWTNQYCIGELEYNGTGNPLSQSSWIKSPNPVFQSDSYAVGVGHASFTVSPDGTQDWIVYHAHNTTGDFTGIRDIRIQQFTFNADGTPNFGSPVNPATPLEEPSGTPHLTPAFDYPVYPTAPAAATPNSLLKSAAPVLTITQPFTTLFSARSMALMPIFIAVPPPPLVPPKSANTVLSLLDPFLLASATPERGALLEIPGNSSIPTPVFSAEDAWL